MNESDYITVIAEWLRSVRITVNLYAHDLPHIGGLYRSETRTIWINVPDARGALLTLAHEAGHVMSYLYHRNNDKRPALFRERQAYVYGWDVLKLFGADRIISRTEWIRECKESHVEFMKPEAHEVFAAATAHADVEMSKSITRATEGRDETHTPAQTSFVKSSVNDSAHDPLSHRRRYRSNRSPRHHRARSQRCWRIRSWIRSSRCQTLAES